MFRKQRSSIVRTGSKKCGEPKRWGLKEWNPESEAFKREAQNGKARLGNVRARLGNMRLESVKARLRKSRARRVTLANIRVRLGNVRARLRKSGAQRVTLVNVRAQRSFSKADKARHLQLYLSGLCNIQIGNDKETEHQQLRRSWLEDNRFGKCIEQKRALKRPSGVRKHSGIIRLERFCFLLATC